MIYFALIHSHLNYGVEIYGNCCQTYMNKLMVLNNNTTILQNAPWDSKVVDLYNNFNTFTLPNLHKFNILLFVHKFFHHRHQLPQFFSSYFTQKKTDFCITIILFPKMNFIYNYFQLLWGKDLLHTKEVNYGPLYLYI